MFYGLRQRRREEMAWRTIRELEQRHKEAARSFTRELEGRPVGRAQAINAALTFAAFPLQRAPMMDPSSVDLLLAMTRQSADVAPEILAAETPERGREIARAALRDYRKLVEAEEGKRNRPDPGFVSFLREHKRAADALRISHRERQTGTPHWDVD